MNNKQQKVEQQGWQGWLKTMGIYQDERSDSVNAQAFRSLTWLFAFGCFIMGIYQLTQASLSSIPAFITAVILIGWFTWQQQRLGSDERAQFLLEQQDRTVGLSIVMSMLFGFVIASLFTTVGVEWFFLMAIPSLLAVVIQIQKRIIFPKTAVFLLALLLLPVLYFFLISTTLAIGVIWSIMIALFLGIAAFIYINRK